MAIRIYYCNQRMEAEWRGSLVCTMSADLESVPRMRRIERAALEPELGRTLIRPRMFWGVPAP